MEKKKWLWKRRSSERSPGESDSSGSFSSCSERYSDEQDPSRESPINDTQSPEVVSASTNIDVAGKEHMKSLTEKLSAALVNVSAKEDLVKQHAKVAEEAVAGWEKAENEVAAMKQQLETSVQQNMSLEVRVNHLDCALKECVKQLRQARDEQEQRISDAVMEKQLEWETTKAELDKRMLELQERIDASSSEKFASDPNTLLVLQEKEKANVSLVKEIESLCKDLERAMIERDLSTQTAETASKQQLESIKRIVKLEAECRKLQASVRKSSPTHKFVSDYCSYSESLTDSHSDGGQRQNALGPDPPHNQANWYETSCSDSCASALIIDLDNFRNEKSTSKSLATRVVEMEMMDDFLEMERLAALPDSGDTIESAQCEDVAAYGGSSCPDNPFKDELDVWIHRVAELEKKLEKVEADKLELERALDDSQASLQETKIRLADSEIRLEELNRELTTLNKAKEILEIQLIGIEAESRTMSSYIDSLKGENEKERILSAELKVKCQELEDALTTTIKDSELQQSATPDSETKLKKEDLSVAADKLADCQKTIASLGRQLKSLATLEDFLIDTSSIPGFSSKSLLSNSQPHHESNKRKCDFDPSRISMESTSHLENGEKEESPLSSSSSANYITSARTRNGFGKYCLPSKSDIVIDYPQNCCP